MSSAQSEGADSIHEVPIATSTDHDATGGLLDGPRQRKPIEPLEVVDQSQDSSADQVYPTGAKFYLICLAMGLVLVLSALDSNIVATAVPSIVDHFHTVADVGWYYTAFKLTSASFQFMFGKMYKLFPLKRVFVSSLLIFLVGSVVCAAAPTSRVFVLGRAITGFGGGGVIAGCFNILVHICPLRQRPFVTSVFGAVEFVSVIIAPLLGGVLTERLSWRWCFWINLPIGGAALVGVLCFLSDPRADGTIVKHTTREMLSQLDLVGNLVLLPSLTCLFLALTWAGTKYPWNDPIIISLFVLFGVLLAVFAIDQHIKQDAATLPPRIIKNRNVISGLFFIFCMNAATNIFEYYMPTYFQVVKGYSPARSGYMMLPLIIASLIGMLLGGAGASLIGYYTPFALIASILTPIGSGLMTTWTLDTDLAKLILYSGIVGFGGAIGFSAPQSAVQTVLSPADAPMGLGVIVFGQGFGPALFVAIAQTIFTNRLVANLHHLAPGLNAASIENMGFAEMKASLGAANLDHVLMSFHQSLSETWYLPVGLACFTLMGSLGLEWRSVKQKQN